MKRIHLIGICGTAMATLAAMLKSEGYDVRGSDQNVYPPMSDFLAEQQIVTLQGYEPEHISRRSRSGHRRQRHLARQSRARGGAGPEDPVLLAARSGARSLPLGVALDRDRRHARQDDDDVADRAGCSRTAAPIRACSSAASPTISAAAIRLGGGREFVIEGDEYDSAFFDKTAKFLKYLPDIVVVNNIEYDHADIYPDLESIRVAFRRLVNLIPRRGLAARRRGRCRRRARWRRRPGVRSRRSASPTAPTGRRTICALARDRRRSACGRSGRRSGQFEVPLLGAYNVRNALAAIAVGAAVGLNIDTIAQGLLAFKGVRRRMQLRGTAAASRCTTTSRIIRPRLPRRWRGVRSAYPDRRVWAIFEPRSATSCRRIFQSEFVRAFSDADRILLPDVFRSSLPEDQRLSVEQVVADLKARGKDARYIPQVDDIVCDGRARGQSRRPRRRDVERRLRRHPPEAADRSGSTAAA